MEVDLFNFRAVRMRFGSCDESVNIQNIGLYFFRYVQL